MPHAISPRRSIGDQLPTRSNVLVLSLARATACGIITRDAPEGVMNQAGIRLPEFVYSNSGEGASKVRKFRDRDTERFANGDFVKAFSGFAAQADPRLDILLSARALDDLASLRSNNLEQLRGGREGQWSIRINRQYRICFEWHSDENGPVEIEIVDYHR